jgi:hypothetical protein
MSGTEMPEQVRVLARFVPSELTTEIIQAEIRPLLPPCCQRERISVRVPQGITPHPDNLEWHHDGMPAYHMVIWANEDSTQIRLPNGQEFQGQPHDVVWFNNEVVQHRQPRGTNETTRWFVSVRCSGA